MAPKPKIPPQYADAAQKLASEGGDLASSFAKQMQELAGGLSDNLESRSVPLGKGFAPNTGTMGENMRVEKQSVREAGVFARTENGVTPNISEDWEKSRTEFDISMDELLSKYGEPKSVEGSGVMKPNYVMRDDGGVLRPSGHPETYDKTTGILMESSGYTPNTKYPSADFIPRAPRGGYGRTIDVRQENAIINDELMMNDAYRDIDTPLFFKVDDEGQIRPPVENIPGIGLLATAGVGAAALASTPAQAEPQQSKPKPTAFDKLAKLQMSGEAPIQQESTFSKFLGEAEQQLRDFYVEKKSEFTSAVSGTIQQYELQKNMITARAAEATAKWDKLHPDAPMSDIDKELMLHTLGATSEQVSPLMQGVQNVQMASAEVKAFKANVLDPLRHTLQAAIRKDMEPKLAGMREKAPSIAVLQETLFFPLLGQTEFNVDPSKFSMFNSSSEDDKVVESMPPIVQKLLADKTALLGTDAGAALLSFAAGYSELPLWLIGGASTKGLAVGGMANEVMRDDGDLAMGAATGVVGGKVVQRLAKTKVVTEGINLLAKGAKGAANAVADAGDNLLIRKGTQDMAADAFMRIVERTPKRTFEPVAMATKNAVNKLADTAAGKADTVISKRFSSGELKPQIIVLDLGEDGVVHSYGVHNGKVGEIVPSGPTDATVITTRRAAEGWPEEAKVRDIYKALTENVSQDTRGAAVQDWHNGMLPPNNPELVFAWEKKDTEGMLAVYKAGSDEFNSQLLGARSLVKTTYTGPDGNDKVGLGFLNSSGAIMAPDASEGIPGAIPRDLIFTQTHLDGMPDVIPPARENTAWTADVVSLEERMMVSRSIKDGNELQLQSQFEIERGGMHPNGVPIEAPPAAFDNLPDNIDGDKTGAHSPRALRGVGAGEAIEVNMALIPGLPYMGDIAKAIGKIRANVAVSKPLTGLGKSADKWLFPATSYGEVFKIDAAIQQFSARHFKRYITDMERQLAENFGTGPNNNPAAREKFSQEVRDFIVGAQRATPPSLAPHVQAKVNAFTNERNADYALIEQLGGVVPAVDGMDRNVDIERMYATDYLTPAEWVTRLKKEKPYLDDASSGLISLTKDSMAGKAERLAQPDLFGKQKIERDMALDYFKRKSQISQLTVMAELAANPKAASAGQPNTMLGHTKIVDFDGAGKLKGMFVDEATYDAIRTFPKEQEIVVNQFLAMLKYNKTVLNPGTWLMNTMGNVWGAMLSNIVSPLNMAVKLPLGVRTMKKDLAAYNADMTKGASPAADRVHETLKFGLLGAEYELNKGRINEVIDGLLTAKEKTWGEKITAMGHKVRENTTGALGNRYSSIDMMTKYSLYVNGLERWGIDLSTNSMPDTPAARLKMGKLLGHAVVAGMDAATATEAGKRAIVRRIHLTLPMVDRASPVVTGLSKYAGVTSPWLRTGLELARINAQLPYRAFTEPEFATTMLKTGGFLGAIYAANKMVRMQQGISDEKIAGAVAMAPDSQKKYMGAPMATFMRADDGGIIFVDAAKGLVESLQWFKGDESDSMGKRVAVNLLDTTFSGGVVENEYNSVMAKAGLKDAERTFNTPIWKQDDWQRGAMDMLSRLGPQVINNGWNLYNTSQLPPRRNEVRRPTDIVVMRALGLPVESWGTQDQLKAEKKSLNMEKRDLQKQYRNAGRQEEGSSTGAWQDTYNKKEVRAKIKLKKNEVKAEKKELIRLTEPNKEDFKKK